MTDKPKHVLPKFENFVSRPLTEKEASECKPYMGEIEALEKHAAAVKRGEI